MKNNYGFGLLGMIIVMFSSLLCLVVCVIAYNKSFGTNEQKNSQLFPSITTNNENTDVVKVLNDKKEQSLTKQEQKYKILEDDMINSAKIYITNNYPILKDKIVISLNNLIKEGYIKQLIDPNNTKKACNGYIIYDGNYTAYLNCEGNFISDDYDFNFE